MNQSLLSIFLTGNILTGNRILDSKIGQGLLALFNDGIGAGQLVGCLVIVFIFIMVCIKKSKEEEQERKRYTSWQIALAALFVLIVLAQDIFDLVISYFG